MGCSVCFFAPGYLLAGLEPLKLKWHSCWIFYCSFSPSAHKVHEQVDLNLMWNSCCPLYGRKIKVLLLFVSTRLITNSVFIQMDLGIYLFVCLLAVSFCWRQNSKQTRTKELATSDTTGALRISINIDACTILLELNYYFLGRQWSQMDPAVAWMVSCTKSPLKTLF